MASNHTFLFVGQETDSIWIATLQRAVSSLGSLRVVPVEAAEDSVIHQSYDVCIIDSGTVYDMPQLITYIRTHCTETRIIVVTASPTWRRAKEALQAGAMDYIRKSTDEKELWVKIRSTLEKSLLEQKAIEALRKDAKAQTTILLADNNLDFSATWAEFLQNEGYEVISAADPVETKRLLEQGRIDLAILDIRLVDDDDEKDTSGIKIASEVAPLVPKILLTRFPSYVFVRQAMNPSSAIDFVAKQEGPNALIASIEKIIEKQLKSQLELLLPEIRTAKSEEVLAELARVKANLDLKARKQARVQLWSYVSGLIALWSGLAILTDLFGWDKMEPWTYFIGIGITFCSYAYFAVTQRELSPRAIYERALESKTRKIYQVFGFDLEKFETLNNNE